METIGKNNLPEEAINQTSNANTSETTDKKNYNSLSQSELINCLRQLVSDRDPLAIKDEVENIKQTFYKKHRLNIENQKKTFIEQGGNENDFIPQTDDSESILKDLINQYKKRKNEVNILIEKEKNDNLSKKNEIIAKLKELTNSTEDLSETIPAFRKLEQEWRNIGVVPANENNKIWKEYNILQERFYDLIKINNELREYDFKKNLELKTAICETAEELTNEENIIVAFKKLQQLHDEWKNIGPIERNIREEVWERFKNASGIINKKHQQYFENIRAGETENLTKKESICNAIESIDITQLTTFKQWEEKSEFVIQQQKEWKQIGFAPRKENVKIYNRFRAACNLFFQQKNQFYKELKEEFNQNLEKKKALCQQAEELKESTDWAETTKKITALQKEWKNIGSVQKKYSDAVWKRFISACNYFFEKQAANFSDKKHKEEQNLTDKKAIIEKIQNFQLGENRDENLQSLRELSNEFSSIGHVPFKEKDKIFAQFKAALNKHYDTLQIDTKNRRLNQFTDNIAEKTNNDLNNERRRLLHQYDTLQNEIKTYENNLGFLSSSSKKGNKFITDIERKISNLKEECDIIAKKIGIIDQKA